MEHLAARCQLNKHKGTHTQSDTHTNRLHSQLYFLVDELSGSLAKEDKQKAPLSGCSVMRGSLIVNMLLCRVFHLTAGQKEPAIKFRSLEASML